MTSASGVAAIALTLGHLFFGLSASICRKGSTDVNLFLELTGFATSDIASIAFARLYKSAFTRSFLIVLLPLIIPFSPLFRAQIDLRFSDIYRAGERHDIGHALGSMRSGPSDDPRQLSST